MNSQPARSSRRLGFALSLASAAALALFLTSASASHFEPLPESIAAEYLLQPDADAWECGRAAYDQGDFERAVAYWHQVPTSHPEYPRSLRYIGWEVYANELDEPSRGLRYVHRCLLVDPFDGNTWQDLGRTYAALIGV